MVVHKIAAIIRKDKKLLLVKEHGLDILITPGGRQETNETAEETLRRELREELNLELISMKFFGRFKDKVYQNNDDLLLETYLVDVSGVPKIDSEIEKLFWINTKFDDKRIKISMPIKRYIIPKLIEMKLIE